MPHLVFVLRLVLIITIQLTIDDRAMGCQPLEQMLACVVQSTTTIQLLQLK